AIDGESNAAPTSQAHSLPNRGAAQPNRYSEQRQLPSSAAERYQDRRLDEDRISLNANNEKSGSMTQRFANMLKQYSNGAAESDDHVAENEDSLSALLQRQNKHRESYNQEKPAPYLPDSPLAKLIAQDNRFERPTPKLDPTRYDRRRPSDEREDSSSELENMREEMTSIRRLLEHQVSGLMWQEVERREPLRAMLIKRLERMGVSPELADQMACYIPEDTKPARAWKALLSLVADQISVTTDTYRIGAHEQLSIYGRIMGCPVRVAKDSNELADVIYQLRNRRLILVDTAGMGQRDVRLSEQLDTLMQESGEVIHSYLVLPATAQRRVLQETLDHFRRIPLSGCILTKLDESLSLGEFISVVIQNAMPVAYIANGQRVPEDIVIAQPKYMIAKANELLEKSTENEPHFWNSDSEGL
ncbi:flagellar biosynthesis protein FlhF, partial [Vibrio owensii]